MKKSCVAMCSVPKTCLRHKGKKLRGLASENLVPRLPERVKEACYCVLSHPRDVIISQVMCSLNNEDSNMENTLLLQLALLSWQIFQKQNSKMILCFELMAKLIFHAKDRSLISL